MNKKYIVEAVGAFLLTFLVMSSLVTGSGGGVLPTFMLAGLTYMALVFMLGRVSGGHFNPAISIGAWSVGKLDIKDLPFYVVMQVAGAVLARVTLGALGELSMPTVDVSKPVLTMLYEAVGMLVLAMGFASVVMAKEKLSSSSGPFIIGLSLLLGLALSGALGSIGILNPAISVGLNILAWPYLVGPIVGSIIGFNLYKALAS